MQGFKKDSSPPYTKLVDYKIVKFCRLCKTRFVVPRTESKRHYCTDCQLKVDSGPEGS